MITMDKEIFTDYAIVWYAETVFGRNTAQIVDVMNIK